MKEVFIKGYNRRYSINSNGEVFSNYRYNRKNKKIYRIRKLSVLLINNRATVFLPIKINKKLIIKKRYVLTLIKKEFNLKPTKGLINRLKYKDNDIQNNSLDNLYFLKRNIYAYKSQAKGSIYNKNRWLEIKNNFKKHEDLKLYMRNYQKKMCNELSNNYVKHTLCLKGKVPLLLIKLKRENMKLGRLIKQLNTK